MLDQYLTIEMLHKSWSLFLFQELNYMYLILLSSSFNNFSRGIQLNTLYFSCGKDNLISNVNVNILCLVHKPVCRSTVLWPYFATWQICLFYLACVVSFFPWVTVTVPTGNCHVWKLNWISSEALALRF